MNKCLVTTLKAHTNNEALSKYNVLTIKIKESGSPTQSSQWLSIGASENGSVSINSNSVGLYKTGISGELYPYPLEILTNGYNDSHFENKNGIIEVTGKYNLSAIVVGSNGIVRIKEIYGIPGTLKRLYIRNIEEGEFDATKLLNAIDRSEIVLLNLHSEKIVNKISKNTVTEFSAIEDISDDFTLLFDNLSLDDLADNINITTLMSQYLLGGNLSSLAKMTKLQTIQFVGNIQNNGDIMDFINPWIQSGRTSGKIRVYWLLSQENITLNGSPITYPSGVTNATAYLNWTSDGTVTFTAS